MTYCRCAKREIRLTEVVAVRGRTGSDAEFGRRALLQLRVLRLGFFQDGDIGVGVFPEREEVLVSFERTHTSSISIRSLRGS